jgi:hypothetical protein
MLFTAERVAELAAISSRELRLLCAIAPALDSAKAVANVIVETFIVNFSSRGFKSHRRLRFCGRHQIVRIDGGTDDLAPRAQGQLTHYLELAARRSECAGAGIR